jgi:membrane protein DedA with SNARE-associated domain
MNGLEHFVIAQPLIAYLIVFFGMFIEGEGIILIASIFAWQGRLSWLLLAITIISGTILGDIAWYMLGKHLKGTRLGGWLDKIYEKPGNVIEKVITEHYGKFAILSKFMYFTTHPTVFLVGWHDYKFKKFLGITAYASIIWGLAVLLIGYSFGYAISLIGFKKIMKRIEIFALIVFVALFVIERLIKKNFSRIINKKQNG